MISADYTQLVASTTDATSQTMVGVVLIALFALLTLEKVHRVLVALCAVCLLWLITYFTPWRLITFEGAASHIDFNVLLLLAGMMAIVGVLRSTGVFDWMIFRLLVRARGEPARMVGMLVWFTGIISAFADNVTTVIFVTPLALGAARSLKLRPVVLLLPMVLASNVGGTATLIGDPPNIMIGSGAGLSFAAFLLNLVPPVIVMMIALHWFTLRHFRADFARRAEQASVAADTVAPALTSDRVLLRGLLIICALVLVGFLTHGITGMPAAVPAVLGAGAALLLQDVRYLRAHDATQEERAHGILGVLEHEIEWPTLAFFTFLFIIVGAAVETGLVERIATALRDGITMAESRYALSPQATLLLATVVVLWAAAVLSSLIDNIPFVAVSIPIIHQLLPSLSGNVEVLWWALSLGACLGGNGTPVGASANVTTLGLAERGGVIIGFREYLRTSIPLTLITLLIATVYLTFYVLMGHQTAAIIMGALSALAFASMRFGMRRTTMAALLLAAGATASAIAPSAVQAQDALPEWRTVRQEQLWLAITADQPLSDRWAFLGDVQWRRTDWGREPQQTLTRASVTYRLAPGFRFGAGLNRVTTAPYGELPAARASRDHQFFLVAQLNQKHGQLDVMHRFRFENRWLSDVITDAEGDESLSPARFARRARHLLRAAYPVPGGLSIGDRPVTAVLQNEIFVGVGGVDRGISFDQNRFALGAGLPFTRTQRLDVLWLQQWVAVPRARANELNGTLMLMLNHNGLPRGTTR